MQQKKIESFEEKNDIMYVSFLTLITIIVIYIFLSVNTATAKCFIFTIIKLS